MKKLIALFVVLATPCLARCSLCQDLGNPHKIYVSMPAQINIIDDLDVISTPWSVIITEKLSCDGRGLYYLTSEVRSVLPKKMVTPPGDICPDCGRMEVYGPDAGGCLPSKETNPLLEFYSPGANGPASA